MTFDLYMVWSNLCPSCHGNNGRMLHGICKYAIAVFFLQVSELWPLVFQSKMSQELLHLGF